MQKLLETLATEHTLTRAQCRMLLQNHNAIDPEELFHRARAAREHIYHKDIYLRGLIEISNYCHNDCLYCGIRRSNAYAQRYRLTPAQILDCCDRGYALGLRTFVLQGGEDAWFTDERLQALIGEMRARWPDCAITLSLGERSRESYAALRRAGADRFLLRHETADPAHYRQLHPKGLTLQNRIRCLCDLRSLGFQVGAGFMVGSPGQSVETLAQDLLFLQELRPHMVGIGPFIPHRDTPFADKPAGSAELTLFLLAVVRLLLPGALLPATTALGTVADDGWERGMLAGANVIMPNLTPPREREQYQLYDGKDPTAAEERERIAGRMAAIGYRVVDERGDCKAG